MTRVRWAIPKSKAPCGTSESKSMTPWQSQSKSTCDATGRSGSALPSRPRRTEEAYELDPKGLVEVQRVVYIIFGARG